MRSMRRRRRRRRLSDGAGRSLCAPSPLDGTRGGTGASATARRRLAVCLLLEAFVSRPMW